MSAEPIGEGPLVPAAPLVDPAASVQRFDRTNRVLHGLLMLSFLGLALTGLPLLFSESDWAPRVAAIFGGYRVNGVLHRLCGLLMIATFSAHLARLLHRLYVKKEYRILWGPDSLVPQPTDLVQMLQHLRYFVGLGPRPRFDRYTYW